ncbi:hypothetical protein RU09_00300 [Microbacterium sp. MEJ108Y]|nr:hypothetical protein RU09_00300 [Microbacterium sp. MEJ108Y]
MSPDEAYAPLAAALEDYVPPCNGWDMFTSDWLTDEDREQCSSICAGCPIADLCRTYATAAKVDSGFWAGNDHSPKRRRAKGAS